MLNRESRQYFQRAFSASGSAFQPYVLTKFDHVQHVKDCLNVSDLDELMEHLKSQDIDTLLNCPNLESSGDFSLIFAPVIENKTTKNAFLTNHPEDIYNGSDGTPIMDAMFSFTAQVRYQLRVIIKQNEWITFIILGNNIRMAQYK